MKQTALALLVVLLALGTSSTAVTGQAGTITFPTSSAPEIQPLVTRAVALMHSFQYDEAEQAFDEAARRDPSCAMCRWGKAIVLYRQIWGWPTPENFAKGREELGRAQREGAKTPREKAYIAAALVFFESDPAQTHADIVRAYSRQLEQLHRDYPTDADAGAFYALSLIALAGEGVDPLANRRRAIDTLQPFLRDQPNHPGVAHYLIHAADIPDLASQGLEAAKRYAAIAPDSSHALHMPSHIFVRLGVWQDTIDLNLRAAAAGAKAMQEHHGDASYELHAMDYLAYAYLQTGQESKARDIVGALKNVAGANPETVAGFGAFLAGRNALDLHRWSEAAELVVPSRPRRAVEAYRARTIGAVRLGALDTARQNVAGLKQALTALQAQLRAGGFTVPPDAPIELEESEAWLAFAEGRPDDAIAALRRAADREEADGGESLMVPAREMLGDLFLELKRPSDALETYKVALQRAPNRFDSLYGAARAAEMLKAEADAKLYYNRLLGLVAPTADRPEVRDAKAFLKIH